MQPLLEDRKPYTFANCEVKQLIFYGAGSLGKNSLILDKTMCLDGEVIYFCDSDKDKWGKSIIGVEIISPNALERLDRENIGIVITSMYKEEIEDYLKSVGFIHIYYFNHMDTVNTQYAVDCALLEYHREVYGIYNGKPDQEKLTSCICRAADIRRYEKWAREFAPGGTSMMHRKQWEDTFIIQALYERGMLSKDKRDLGFAVGQEFLPSIFARFGCKILATDLHSVLAADWIETNQHADSVKALFHSHICSETQFLSQVDFDFVDMNAIPKNLTDFDFCWSACAFEHLGSIKKGKQFIYNMIDCLKPGGVAVHTTEYNIFSNTKTMDFCGSVFFRKCDLEEIYDHLTAQGHIVEALDYRLGDEDDDNVILDPPHDSFPHLKLRFDNYVFTSFGLIIQKKIA